MIFILLLFLGIYLIRHRTSKAFAISCIVLTMALVGGADVMRLNKLPSEEVTLGLISMAKEQIENGKLSFGIICFSSMLLVSVVLALWPPKRKHTKIAKTRLTPYENDTAFRFPTRKRNLFIHNPFRGTLIVGGAGSGKSRTFIYPLISQSASLGYTGIIYDFKSPELLNYAHTCYSDTPYKTNIIDFKDVSRSQRVNPLAYIESAVQTTNYAQALIFNLMPEFIQRQDFWSRSMLSLLAGTIWFFRKNHPQYATLPHIFAFMFTASSKQLIEILSTDREVKGFISSLAEAVGQGADKQVAGILGTLKNAIGIYNTPDIFWILSKNEVNLDVNNPDDPTMLLIGNDSKLSDTYAPLCSLIITVATKLMNEPNKEKSVIIIDESPTLYLPNFEQIPATARSNRIAVIVGTQDISQMRDKYGREKAEILISNLGNQFFGRTTNKDTAERVVKLFGQNEHKVAVEGSSSSPFGKMVGYKDNFSNSQSIQKRDRIKIQQMTTLNAGEFAGLLAEGAQKEFLEQIVLQDIPYIKEYPSVSKYTPSIANENFEEIYVQMEDFIAGSKKPKTGGVSDKDF